MSQPVLHVFAISHYCEKARWALDHGRIEYQLNHLAPGQHRALAGKLGLKGSSLPFLVNGDEVVHGSSAIIDWVDRQVADPADRLTPTDEAQQWREMEQRLDKLCGVHVRRYYYSEAMVDYPETVRPVFTDRLGWFHRVTVRLAWNKIRTLMIKGLDLGPTQGEASRQVVAGELDWLDGLLADGRAFLAGSRFSRVDITAASLLAPLVLPPEHPVYSSLQIPPRIGKELQDWADRPSLQWVAGIYASHRRP